MATKKKMLQAAAGQAGGAALDITDVFSTYLHTGNGSTQTITNGIDLDGEGGLVWGKMRSDTDNHNLFDTERGATSCLFTDQTNAQSTVAGLGVTAFNADGFNVAGSRLNASGFTYASWTFRKAPKFFDVVTFTGTGSPQTIAHNLGSVPGMIIVKDLDRATSWAVYHRGAAVSPETVGLRLNLTTSIDDSIGYWNDTAPTSTHFTVGDGGEVGGNTGDNLVAYLFAHNDGDGEFGADGDQDIIKCGSYTGTGAAGNFIDLGFEPQWVMIKNASATGSWWMLDVMRGASATAASFVFAESSGAESSSTSIVEPQATGFNINNTGSGTNTNGASYIYIAIRRGPLAPPESGTEVFDVAERGQDSPPPAYRSGFVTDMFINRADVTLGGNNFLLDRLRGNIQVLLTEGTDAEAAYGGSAYAFDQMEGVGSSTNSDVNNYSWMFRRAPSFFDVVAYTGDGVAGRTVSHNLGVAPEMMWVKRRDNTDIWVVYNETVGNTGFLRLNDTNAVTTAAVAWNDTSPTATDFTLGTYAAVNTSGSDYIAYLFATLAGVSKVGSVSHTNGTDTNVDCGFSSGARFILIKRTDGASSWYVFDTERGIVAGDDKALYLQSTLAEQTADWIDPYSSGFTMVGASFDSGTYIFYAIA